MGDQILVSVICTCFNKGKWVRQALDSVLAQETSFPFEVIVVDDASTDESLIVIAAFRDEHPDSVRVIAHEVNQGISTTWAEACREARGTYIARIDGDDYWTDSRKLEMQVQALEQSGDSRWCSTDFDMVDTDGNLICADAIESGRIAVMDSYEKMLAMKGLTNSSTWLVDAQLMREANAGLDASDADDTFSIQLELFHATRLSRIDRSMCAMRVNAGSDSRPMSQEGAEKRFTGLMRQQLAYLDKFDDADYRELARYLIMQDADKDLETFKRDRRISELRREIAERDELIAQLQSSGLKGDLGALKNVARSAARRMGLR